MEEEENNVTVKYILFISQTVCAPQNGPGASAPEF